MTPYKQVLHLQATEQWPNSSIPQWAKDIAEEYQCAPEDERVQLWALQNEIHRLHDVIVCVAAQSIPNGTLKKMIDGENCELERRYVHASVLSPPQKRARRPG